MRRQKAYRHLRFYLNRLERSMKREGLCRRLENSGSATEGLKVNDEMEFDVMSIFSGVSIEIFNVEGYPGYAYLSTEGWSNTLQRFMDSNYNCLSPSIFMEKNFEEIKYLVEEELEGLQQAIQIKVKKLGPSIRLTFKQNGNLLFKADIVPTIEIEKNGKLI